MDDERDRFNIDELAGLGGVSRRTVRYYVQEGLLPKPLGVGRGKHYDRSHLDRLLQVKAEQEAGRSLDDIRARPTRIADSGPPESAPSQLLSRSTWHRFDLAPGVELHVAHDVTLPAGSRPDELAEWCRRYFSPTPEGED